MSGISGGDSLVVNHQASDRKIADPSFDSLTGNASLCSWKRHFTLISHRNQAVFPLLWPSLTRDLQIELKKVLSALVWLEGCRVPVSYERTNQY